MIHSGTQTEVRKHRRRDEHTPNRDEMLEKNYGEDGGSNSFTGSSTNYKCTCGDRKSMGYFLRMAGKRGEGQ